MGKQKTTNKKTNKEKKKGPGDCLNGRIPGNNERKCNEVC